MDFLRYCAFSDVEGRVLYQGKPVANAPVERTYRVEDKPGVSDTKTTDVNGYFKFKPIWKYSLWTMTPFELTIFQEMWIHQDGKKHEAWRHRKARPLDLDSELPNIGQGEKFDPNVPYDINANYPKRKIRLLCELSEAPTWKEPKFGTEVVFGVCRVVEKL